MMLVLLKLSFLVDNVIASIVTTPPYELQLNISEYYTTDVVKVAAIAYDSAGKRSELVTKQLQIIDLDAITIPRYEFEKPVSQQQVVESTPLTYSISHFLGPVETSYNKTSGIEKVTYFF